MLIKNYGLFWRASEIEWHPGQGIKDSFRLLGRNGSNRPNVRVADFRHQQGIYILYGNYGPYYVGLTRRQGLGKRLKDHLMDEHADLWDRFSWFGFQKTLKSKNPDKTNKINRLKELSLGKTYQAIGDIEALLIKAMGLSNIAQMKFANAEEWVQVEDHEVEYYLGKIE
jgi:hypothetical protein